MNIFYTPEKDQLNDLYQGKEIAVKYPEICQKPVQKSNSKIRGSLKSKFSEQGVEEELLQNANPGVDRVKRGYKYNPDLPFFTQFPAESQEEGKL